MNRKSSMWGNSLKSCPKAPIPKAPCRSYNEPFLWRSAPTSSKRWNDVFVSRNRWNSTFQKAPTFQLSLPRENNDRVKMWKEWKPSIGADLYCNIEWGLDFATSRWPCYSGPWTFERAMCFQLKVERSSYGISWFEHFKHFSLLRDFQRFLRAKKRNLWTSWPELLQLPLLRLLGASQRLHHHIAMCWSHRPTEATWCKRWENGGNIRQMSSLEVRISGKKTCKLYNKRGKMLQCWLFSREIF